MLNIVRTLHQNRISVVLSMLLAVGTWLLFHAVYVPDNRLDILLSVQADDIADGSIWWDERQKPYEDGWPFNLASIQFQEDQEVTVEIKPVVPGSVNASATSNQVRVYNIATDVVPIIDWSNVYFEGGWGQRESRLPSGYIAHHSSGSPSDTFIYRTQARNWIRIVLPRCEWCEGAQITINGKTTVLDLYRNPDEINTETRYTFFASPFYSTENVGTLSLPLPGNTDHFSIHFEDEVNRVKLYEINRTGSVNWQWQPEEPLFIEENNTFVATTTDQAEVSVSSDNNLSIAFANVPATSIPKLNSYHILFIIALFISSLIILSYRSTIWRILCYTSSNVYKSLKSPPSSVQTGTIGIIILSIALIIRTKYALENPLVLLPGDSPAYLSAAFWIKHGFSYPLQPEVFDLRAPGYPFFLSAALWLLGSSYTSILIAQIGVGLLTVYGGIRFGELLGNRWISIFLGFFFAVSPDQMYYSHLIMTEVLSIAAVVWCSVFGLQYIRQPNKLLYGLLFACCSAFAMYNRPNVIPVIAFWFLLAFIVSIVPLLQNRRAYWRLGLYLSLTGLTFVAIISPWIIRNGQIYERYNMVAATDRARLLFWMNGHLTDFSTPRMLQLAHTYTTSDGAGGWTWGYKLGENRIEGEILAQALWQEQIAYHRDSYIQRVVYVTNNLLGTLPGGPVEGRPRPDVRFQPRSYIPDQYDLDFGHERLEFIPYGEYGILMQTYNWLWQHIFHPARLPISIISLSLMVVVIIYTSVSSVSRKIYNIDSILYSYPTIILLGIGMVWVATVAALSVNLAYQPRYIVPFDWIRIAIVAKGVELCWLGIMLLKPDNLRAKLLLRKETQ